MHILRHVIKTKEQKMVSGQAIKNNVVSTIKKQNQKIEKRLSDCMKEIQQMMVLKRQLKNQQPNKVMIKTSVHSFIA